MLDKELLLCDAQRICDAGTTEYSENAIDLGAARNIAKGQTLYVVIIVDVLFAGTGATLTISVVSASDNNLTSDQVVQIATPAIAKSVLTAGRVPIVLALPPLPAAGGAQRYLGLKFVCDNTSFETTGSITAFIALDASTNF